jgi:hypothetical protein
VCLASGTTANNSVPNQTATLMTDGGAAGGGQTVSQGRLNFGTSPWAALQPHHIITLVDSQPGLTRGTVGYRAPASAMMWWLHGMCLRADKSKRGAACFGAGIDHELHRRLGDSVRERLGS